MVVPRPLARTGGLQLQRPGETIVVGLDGSWDMDDELLDGWVERGRWTQAEVAAIRHEGAAVAAELDAGRRWWSDDWAAWEPDPTWRVPALPTDWAADV